jgi:hypothetical protein
MTQYARLWLSISFSLLLAACSASGPLYHSSYNPHKGNFYVYRGDDFVSISNKWDVFLDGQQVDGLANAGYLYLPVSPGSHEIKVVFWHDWIGGDKVATKSFSVPAGGTYYLKITSRQVGSRMMSGGVMVPQFDFDLNQVSPVQARQELEGLHLSQ